MLTKLGCRNGHQWEQGDGTAICPVCGADAVDLGAATGTLPMLADVATLPPSPASTSAAADTPSFLVNHLRYRVQELLGRGGMGAVYKAQHLLMQRTVALKVINADLTSNSDTIKRFHREVQAVARLSHRSIVAAYDAEQVGDAHFLVMEYVPGASFAKIVAEQGPLPVATACEWICQAAEGLHHAHMHGHIHRDIKPQNLMITPDGQVKILDFGLARLATEGRAEEAPAGTDGSAALHDHSLAAALTRAGSVMGTPDYIAPEQANDSRVADIRSDIYSLGCTFYFLLTGNAPFSGATVLDKLMAHQEQQAKPVTAFRHDVPAVIDQIVEKMMAKRPADRYQTPAEVTIALEPWRIPTAQVADAAADVITVVPVSQATKISPPIKVAPAPRRRGRLLLGCIATILVTLLGCAGVTTWIVHYTSNKIKEIGGMFRDQSSKNELWNVVEETWQPPPGDSKADEIFPRTVGSYTRIQHDSETTIEPLQLHLPGLRAVYRSGVKQIEVIAAARSETERDAVFLQAKSAVDGNKKSVRMSATTGSAKAKRFIYMSGSWKGVMWWSQGWLFAVHSKTDDDPERMLISLLRAIGKSPPKKPRPE